MTRPVLGGRPAKLTRDQADAIRRHRAAGISSQAIARVYGVNESTVRRYLRGEVREHELNAESDTYVRYPRNCWTLTCSRCLKFKPVRGGTTKPRFVCAECRS